MTISIAPAPLMHTATSSLNAQPKVNEHYVAPKINQPRASMKDASSATAHITRCKIIPIEGLPKSVAAWLSDTKDKILTALNEEIKDRDFVFRHETAGNTRVQKLLFDQGEKLEANEDFIPSECTKKFKAPRRASEGERNGIPSSRVEIPKETAAWHTAVGLGEIVCKDDWKVKLAEHFVRAGKPPAPIENEVQQA